MIRLEGLPRFVRFAFLAALALPACLACSEKKPSAESAPPAPVQVASVPAPAASPRPVQAHDLSSPHAFVPLVQGTEKRSYVLEVFAEAANPEIVPAVLDEIRFAGLGLEPPLTPADAARLRALTGQHLPIEDWGAWTEWWWRQGPRPEHPGYVYLKQNLFGRLAPGYAAILEPGRPSEILLSELILRPDRRLGDAHALVDPPVVAADDPQAGYLISGEPVVGVEVAGELRAYSVRMLSQHEIVNDDVGGQKILLAYDPLTGGAFAFELDFDGERPIFEPSGLVYRASPVMADRATQSLWSVRDGRPLHGPMTQSPGAARFRRIPVTQSSWTIWLEIRPKTRTLSVETGWPMELYAEVSPYWDYHQSEEQWLPLRVRDPRLKPKERLFGLELNGDAIAFPYSELGEDGIFEFDVGGETLLMTFLTPKDEFYAYRVGSHRMAMMNDPFIISETGTRSAWLKTERALLLGSTDSAGVRLERVPAEVTFWYAWTQAHPATRVFRREDLRARLQSRPLL